MNWLSLALQLLSMRRTFVQSREAIDSARAAAEKAAKAGVRAAMFGGYCAVAGIFVITGLITLILELGLQYDRGQLLHFTGLVGSSLAFFLLAALLVGLGAILTREPREEEAAYVRPPPPLTPEEELRRTAAAFLNRFLARINEPRGPGPGAGAR